MARTSTVEMTRWTCGERYVRVCDRLISGAYKHRFLLNALLCVLGAIGVGGCGDPEEPASMALPVSVDATGVVPVITDLRYRVEVSEVRVMIENLTFAVGGEHEASLQRSDGWRSWGRATARAMERAWVAKAYAHPGHHHGGEVTGELRGRFLLDWLPGTREALLGDAHLLEGRYRSASFRLARAETDDGLDVDDPLVGHTARFHGVAERAGVERSFVVTLGDLEGHEVRDMSFALDVREDVEVELSLRFTPLDPFSNATFFDGIDFDALATEQTEQADHTELRIDPHTQGPGEAAYQVLWSKLQSHAYFEIQADR